MAHSSAYLSAIFLSPIGSNFQSSIDTQVEKWSVKGGSTSYVHICLPLLVSSTLTTLIAALCAIHNRYDIRVYIERYIENNDLDDRRKYFPS